MHLAAKCLCLTGILLLTTLDIAAGQVRPGFLRTWGSHGSGPGQLNYPYGITASPDGSLYVSDQYNFRIIKYSPEGEVLTSWGTRGHGPGQFDLTIGLGVDPEGRVYVADYGNGRVQVFESDGGFVRQWPETGARDVAISADGLVHVVSGLEARVYVFTKEGAPVRNWGWGAFGSPTSIAFDAMGNAVDLGVFAAMRIFVANNHPLSGATGSPACPQ